MELKEVFELIEYINDLKEDDYERFENMFDVILYRISNIEESLSDIKEKLQIIEDDNFFENADLD